MFPQKCLSIANVENALIYKAHRYMIYDRDRENINNFKYRRTGKGTVSAGWMTVNRLFLVRMLASR